VIKETANPTHPEHQFSTGNSATLGKIPLERIREWFEANYSPKRIHVVAVSSLPIEALTAEIDKKFSRIPERTTHPQEIPFELLSNQQKGSILYIKPIQDMRTLTLMWQVPIDYARDLKTQAANLIATALSSAAPNTLISCLQEKKFIENLSADIDRYSNGCALFMINISLTNTGVQNVDKVITYVFEAIARLKQEGLSESFFQENKQIATLSYQYPSAKAAFEYTYWAGYMILGEGLATFPQMSLVPSTYNASFISRFIQTLTPSSCVYILRADPKLAMMAANNQEPWMNVPYSLKPASPQNLLAWQDAKPTSSIQTPPLNPYIPDKIALIEPSKTSPSLLIKDDGAAIYYCPDERYRLPKIATCFEIKTPLLDGSAKAVALADLFLEAASEQLLSIQRFGEAAGLGSVLTQNGFALKLSFGGFNDKAIAYLADTFKTIKNIHIEQDKFEQIKQAVASGYDQESKQLPYRLAIAEMRSVLTNCSPATRDKLAALNSTTYEEFCTFSSTLLQKTYVQGTIYGNISKSDAETLWAKIKPTFGSVAYPENAQKKKTVLVLPESSGPYLLAAATERLGNGFAMALQLGEMNFDKWAMQQILSSILSDGYFDTLRTKQQVAYGLAAQDVEEENQLSFRFIVQSSTHNPSDLLHRTEQFLENNSKNLETIADESRFETIKAAVLKDLELPPENLSLRAAQIQALAFTYDADFEFLAKRAAAVRALTYSDFISQSKQALSRSNNRRLAVLMEGMTSADFRYKLVTQEELQSMGKFVSAN
jgi:insulysin